jgi:hypothetical protein
MKQILHYSLWIGDARDGRDFQTLKAKRIRAIVQLASEDPPVLALPELVCLRFPLRNGEENTLALLHSAIEAVTGLLELGVPTLVFCGAGMARAQVIAAASLSVLLRAAFTECLAKLSKEHSTRISPGLLADVATVLQTWQEPQDGLTE